MDNDAPLDPAPPPDTGQPRPALPWFTADEVPKPTPEMRRPPKPREPTLFDDLDDG